MASPNVPLPYELFAYQQDPSAYYLQQPAKIPVEYTGSDTLDERDRRRRKSTSKDKDTIPSMHLVSLAQKLYRVLNT